MSEERRKKKYGGGKTRPVCSICKSEPELCSSLAKQRAIKIALFKVENPLFFFLLQLDVNGSISRRGEKERKKERKKRSFALPRAFPKPTCLTLLLRLLSSDFRDKRKTMWCCYKCKLASHIMTKLGNVVRILSYLFCHSIHFPFRTSIQPQFGRLTNFHGYIHMLRKLLLACQNGGEKNRFHCSIIWLLRVE